MHLHSSRDLITHYESLRKQHDECVRIADFVRADELDELLSFIEYFLPEDYVHPDDQVAADSQFLVATAFALFLDDSPLAAAAFSPSSLGPIRFARR